GVGPELTHSAGGVICAVVVVDAQIQRIVVDEAEEELLAIEPHAAEHAPRAQPREARELLERVSEEIRADRHERSARMRAWLSVLADVPEIHPERAELAVQVGALHADALGELPHLAVAQQQLLLQIGPLELLARLAQRQRQKILLHQRLIRRRLHRELALDLIEPD